MSNIQALPCLPEDDLWVFGYGSLMWRPGFDYSEVYTAKLYGYHRSLCVWSWVHRGTPDNPGLVFGLDTGGSCIGRAFRVPAPHKQAVVNYLFAREMVTPIYLPRFLRVHWENRSESALTFVIDRSHVQYAGKLGAELAVAVVRRARGQSGHNLEYLVNTLAHLKGLGIRDRKLREMALLMAAPDENAWRND